MYVNGTNVYTTSNMSVASSIMNIGTMDIGGWSVNQANSFYGGISSLAIYNTVLTTSQRQQVEGYLAWKWWGSGSAILTNTSHPYYSVPIGDIGMIFNSSTIDVLIKIPGTNTNTCYVLGAYGMSPWELVGGRLLQ